VISNGSWRPVVVGGVAGALAMLASLNHGTWSVLVPFAAGIVVALFAAQRGARPLVAAGVGLAAAILCVLLLVAAVIAIFVVAVSNQPWSWIRVAALVVAVAGAALAWRAVRDRRTGVYVLGLAIACAAGLVGLHPLGRAIQIREAPGLPPATYPPEAGTDARRTLPLASGDFSLGVHDIAYLNGEGGDPTHQLIARWRPPLGLVAERRPITDLCGSIDRPCPHWFIVDRGGQAGHVVEEQGLALEPGAERGVNVRATTQKLNDPAYAGVPYAWTIELGPWQWWRGLVWVAGILLAVSGSRLTDSRSGHSVP
jgi:hypothetical protein